MLCEQFLPASISTINSFHNKHARRPRYVSQGFSRTKRWLTVLHWRFSPFSKDKVGYSGPGWWWKSWRASRATKVPQLLLASKRQKHPLTYLVGEVRDEVNQYWVMTICCLVAKLCLTFLRPRKLWPARLFCPWDYPARHYTKYIHYPI